ncbi:hypothetical protein PLEOSDRAFT_1090226 [Pleurotus ostreatus PC15]|uniref:Uncharacterized protein n=1 Tax=Pleurotus ostreatus (strain PC15) TaxID=1137138 RepID=A0A067NR71_PLEO1|nr:hypothetical protein PLEOSDRAFT_1090226 [Pleurotus ostreatus PC15]
MRARRTWMRFVVGRGECGAWICKTKCTRTRLLSRLRCNGIMLKPQRDADRNKKVIPRFLDELPVSDRKAWVTMESIVPPKGTANYLIRASGVGVRTEVVNESRIFRLALLKKESCGRR